MHAEPKLSDADLDAVYTALCRELTACGEARAPLLLSRFALLAMLRIGDRREIEQLIRAAADGLGPA